MGIKHGALGLVSLAVLCGSAIGLGQEGSRIQVVARQPNWGTVDASSLSVSAWDFEPFNIDIPWTTTQELYRYRLSGGEGFLVAGFHLPTGSLVTGIAVEACDTSSTGSVEMSLYRCPAGTENACANIGVSTGVGGTPGCGIFTADLTSQDIVIDNAAVSYHLVASMGSAGTANSIRAARLYYRLQVSPAPAQATFADVPTNHPFFRFVEALVASGITSGCGGGNYCPNSALTRGQMAVFLATALGLHWD